MSKKSRYLLSRGEWQMRARYGGRVEELSALLYRFDPLALVPFGVPTDEYDVEAEIILERLLPGCRSAEDVLAALRERFTLWFDPQAGGNERRCRTLSVALWNWSQRRL